MADVLVVVEYHEGRLHDASLEALTKATEVASSVGGKAIAVIMGSQTEAVARAAAAYGSPVLRVESPALAAYSPEGYAQALKALVSRVKPILVLGAHTATGYEIFPYFAGTAHLPLLTDCLDVELREGRMAARKALYNGKVLADVEVTGGSPFVASLRPAVFKVPDPGGTPGSITKVEVAIDGGRIHRRSVGLESRETGDVDITQANIIVAAGRGIKDRANLKLIEDFAEALGGVVAGSRPVVDNQWLPWSRQVGSSGKTVKPKLYIACGVSGATQHISGMKGSELIIAINSDPTAPIFDVAHYGIVGDLFKVIPATLKELRGG